MDKKDNRKSIIYTTGLLEKIYNLKTSDIKIAPVGKSYASTTCTIDGTPFEIGLCTVGNNACILSSDEILIIDILLCWKELLEGDDEYININFKDIDWLRNRHKKNVEHIKNAHKRYQSIFEHLNSLYLILAEDKVKVFPQDNQLYKLLNGQLIYENNNVIGFSYNIGELGRLLKASNQMTTIYTNAFNYRLNEDMKYRLLRYMVTSIFMNQVRSKRFNRTHKSILNGICYALNKENETRVISYYDYFLDQKYINQYLKRYLSRLNEVLCLLKECNYIKDYIIDNISNERELKLGFGKVEICTNMSQKTRRK